MRLYALHWPMARIRPKSQKFKIGYDGILSIGNFILILQKIMFYFTSKTGTITQNELRPPLSRLRDMFCFFYEVGLSTQCPQSLSHEGKTPSITRKSNPAPLG
jgi:hypothetical protein